VRLALTLLCCWKGQLFFQMVTVTFFQSVPDQTKFGVFFACRCPTAPRRSQTFVVFLTVKTGSKHLHKNNQNPQLNKRGTNKRKGKKEERRRAARKSGASTIDSRFADRAGVICRKPLVDFFGMKFMKTWQCFDHLPLFERHQANRAAVRFIVLLALFLLK